MNPFRALSVTFALRAILWMGGLGSLVPAQGMAQEVEVPPPPMTEGIFPCSSCHDGKTVKPNPQRRILKDMHDDIVLKHGTEERWCLDCHNLLERDRLHLINGEKIAFTASYRLCGQCHGDKYRDWRAGIHGKRTGQWNGLKQYQLCVNCHNPHSPRFQPIAPLPPPPRAGTPPKKRTHGGGAK